MWRAAAAALVLSYAPAAELCRLQDPAVDESSGVSASSASDDILFTHNDSGDGARFYAFDRRGATVATFTVTEAGAEDWEDMARGLTRDGRPALFFADIGDNFRRRPSVTVYEVAEPDLDRGSTGEAALVSRRHLRYDDGAHDAETLLVEPRSGDLLVVTKDRDGLSGVYRAAAGDEVLRRVGEIRFDRLVRRAGSYAKAATSGDIAPDGQRVVVRTPFEAFEWDVGGDGVVAAFARTPRRIALPETKQGEAVAYTRDGRSLVTTSEGVGAPVHLVRGDRQVGPDLLAPRGQAPATPGGAEAEAEAEADEEGGALPGWVAIAAVAGAAVGLLSLGLRGLRGRRRRLRRPPRRPVPPA
jgi:hypothetical protein